MKNINNRHVILILIISTALASCDMQNKKKDKVWGDLPEVTRLDDLKRTDFIPALENPIIENKNIVYAPAFLYAWNKVKEELNSEVLTDNSNSLEFKLLIQSNAHQNSLTDAEYTVSTEIIDGAIIAKAFFNTTLPFETKLQTWYDPILFNNTKVAAFGMHYYDEEVVKIAKILYYKDDNNFILKLSPKDKRHQIILVKGLNNYQTLKDALELTEERIDRGKQEKTDAKQSWKYEIVHFDVFAIPAISFNIAAHYKYLEEQTFLTKDNKQHLLAEAYQQTGFILNENGAVVESEGIVVVDSVGIEPIERRPKKMVFDKEFLIIIKKADGTNPYFVMKVNNAELLIKKNNGS